jgi:hypothetical protein
MNSIDYTSISASRLLLTLKQQAAQLLASNSLQEQTLLLSFQELESQEQGDLIGHLRMLSAKYGKLLKTFSPDQSQRLAEHQSASRIAPVVYLGAGELRAARQERAP